jgi:hypothetical protein
VTLGASVLGLRGGLTAQPLVGTRGVLAWNGQVFAGLPVALDENDTRNMFISLEAGDCPEEVFAGIEGPYVSAAVGRERESESERANESERRLTRPDSPTSTTSTRRRRYISAWTHSPAAPCCRMSPRPATKTPCRGSSSRPHGARPLALSAWTCVHSMAASRAFWISRRFALLTE